MLRKDRGSRERMGSGRTSSLSAQVVELQSIVRKAGIALDRLHNLCMSKVTSDEDVVLAEDINDELKPLIDGLIHFREEAGDDDGDA